MRHIVKVVGVCLTVTFATAASAQIPKLAGPNLLPFIRLAPGTAPGPRRVPRDPPSPPSPPHASRPAGLPNRRHA